MKQEAEFTAFVQARGGDLLRFSRLLVGQPHDAEDVLQTALLRLSRRWPVDEPMAYTRRILINLTTDRGRRAHLVARPFPEREDLQPRLPDPADALASQAFLEQLLRRLPSRQRTTVVLRVVEGLSEAETARAMRCASGTVKSNLSRGLSRLRDLLPEEVVR